MPYITKEARDYIDKFQGPTKPGELNYMLTIEIQHYLKGNNKLCYDGYNEVMGVLACIQQELYRRVIAPHEDHKREIHGEVFTI